MTNAEKFKEVFGFNLNIQAFSEGDVCPFVSEKCRELPCPDCINNYWQSEYKETPMSDEELSKFIADEMDKGSKLFKGAVCKVLEDVRAKIHEAGILDHHSDKIEVALAYAKVETIIDNKIKEIKHESI